MINKYIRLVMDMYKDAETVVRSKQVLRSLENVMH